MYGIFTYRISHKKSTIHTGKSTIPMDAMGVDDKSRKISLCLYTMRLSLQLFLHDSSKYWYVYIME